VSEDELHKLRRPPYRPLARPDVDFWKAMDFHLLKGTRNRDKLVAQRWNDSPGHIRTIASRWRFRCREYLGQNSAEWWRTAVDFNFHRIKSARVIRKPDL
jgi:hypothetical protein